MYKPSIDDMLTGKESRYSLVIAVAKRAREITNEYNARKEVCDDKTVLMAVDDFKQHKYEIVVDDSPEPKAAQDEEISKENTAEENAAEEETIQTEDRPEAQIDDNGEVLNAGSLPDDSEF